MMHKNFTIYILCLFVISMHASDHNRARDRSKAKRKADTGVSKKEWSEFEGIRLAVFEKEGAAFKKSFQSKYDLKSIAAVKELARHFDEEWYEDEPSCRQSENSKRVVTRVLIGGTAYDLYAPVIESIILETRREVLKERGLD